MYISTVNPQTDRQTEYVVKQVEVGRCLQQRLKLAPPLSSYSRQELAKPI